jgi:hypothetical protein
MTRPRTPHDRAGWTGPASGLTFLAGIVAGNALADQPYPRPGSDPDTIRRYFHGNPGPARASSAGQLLSALTLARFTATAVRLAGHAAPHRRVLQGASLLGGATAAGSLAASAGYSAALTTSRADDDTRARTLHRRAFLAGGVVHGAGFGLLVGALGLAGQRTNLLGAPLVRTAIGAAAAGLLSPLYLAAEPAAWFIPAGRFFGLLVTGIAGTRLTRTP